MHLFSHFYKALLVPSVHFHTKLYLIHLFLHHRRVSQPVTAHFYTKFYLTHLIFRLLNFLLVSFFHHHLKKKSVLNMVYFYPQYKKHHRSNQPIYFKGSEQQRKTSAYRELTEGCLSYDVGCIERRHTDDKVIRFRLSRCSRQAVAVYLPNGQSCPHGECLLC